MTSEVINIPPDSYSPTQNHSKDRDTPSTAQEHNLSIEGIWFDLFSPKCF